MTTTYATFKTAMGDIRVRLLPDHAPKTVENFVGLATGKKPWTDPKTREERHESLYAGTTFHRVIPDFMVQGGDPLGTGTGGPGYNFADEVSGGPSFDRPGYLAMANAGPNTNGSQFFITTVATPWLTGKHTIFGEVVSGQDVVEAMTRVPRGPNDRPNQPVVLDDVEISEE
jgi:peptidyl-prolyl cis-trans isomerase A (cyclophilin A)